jgi:DNA (cytosine-5)-methyltransferase 1
MGPKIVVDLFCGAGGASMGLYQAFPGTTIIGVDLQPQPRYPFQFLQADVLALPLDLARIPGAFIWASPPCQRYSAGAGKWGTQEDHPHLIPATRELLIASGHPYCIENIAAARAHLVNPIMLCGTQFDLGVFRHRLFETNFPVAEPTHVKHAGRIGDGKYHTVTGHAGGSSKRDGWKNGGVGEWKVAMGIDWMVGDELAESIPPAFSKYIGDQFLFG